MLVTRFERRGDSQDLDEAMTLLREALDLFPVGHTNRSTVLGNLGKVLSTRFNHRGNDQDLDQAIMLDKDALALCPVGDPDRPMSLNNLASGLYTRFQHRGNDQDLDDATMLHRDALALRPVGHPDRYMSFINLASVLSTRFRHRGNDQDLDDAIMLDRDALALCPVGHPNRSLSLSNLANQLSTRFQHRGNEQDLDDATMLHRDALALRPVGHPDRSMSLNNLANVLYTRFKHRGNDQDLDDATMLHRDALALYPVGHPYRYMSLNNLATVLSTRFQHRGNGQDLDDAIMLNGDALALYPVGHPYRSMSLSNLAGVLSTRFEYRGNDQDLDDAIMLHRNALALHPVGHTNRSSSLNNLATALFTRFQHRGNDQDLDDAIMIHSDALALHPVGHPDRSKSLNNLAIALYTRFKHRDNDQNLDEAITRLRDALALCPVGHADRSKSLSNLALMLSTRFQHQGNDQDLDEAIMLDRDALALRPVGHPDRSGSLHNLANVLSTRFEHRRNVEDLHESRENLCCALTLLTQHHDPRQIGAHESLAKVYLSFHRSQFDGTGEDTDGLNVVMHHHKAAANVVSGGLRLRLQASLLWVRDAHQYSHDTQLEAYATSMELLDASMSATASVSSRHNSMKDFPNTLAIDAASCALRSGDVYRAVELLEQGRTVIWTQMTRLRTSLDGLLEHGDHAVALTKKFRHLSSLLDKSPANHLEETTRVNVEAEASRYRRLVEDWNRVVEEIRKIEGFSRFLLPPLFSDLQDAARDGPIVVLVASKSSCDAIIIPHKQPPISIKLRISLEKLQHLVVKLQRASQPQAAPKLAPETTPKPAPKNTHSALMKALTELWDDIVRPVVDNLGRFAPPGSRIWWCPTGAFNFLPLHAAGEYRQGGQLLSKLYISSCTPSLTALIKARRSHDRSLSVPFAAIGQDHPAGHSFTLECVEPELELVRSLLPPPPAVSFTKITSVDATKSRALRALRDNTWLHFSCHGTQNYTEPFKSAFLMRDHPLSLLDISQMDLSQHEFAFLSACETAVGDFRTPDEVIHLAASLQFAGVQSVVGTLWEVSDSTVQRLVEAFYKNLCGDGKMNSKRAARALHRAVQSLASDKDMPLEQRIVFMHIGI
ncbi:TPR-like protein [Suillus clintonianus]|uniref:TPR-like protein n=1 Tax=Suillus clintonianus TaxID=1904413 RepID=UPI001B86269F|nr:TPR-like protein [Suillus clintonianus]KAG2141095.1 TPR-like protein [Suillus clintonianus]